jgi:hypothetical protein
MVKFLIVSVFTCIEYAIVFLFIASIAFILAQGLDSVVPWKYDYSTEQELRDTIGEGYESEQITSQEGAEILQIYQDEQARGQRLRIYILYAVSICISTAFIMLIFKKYRSLRFRERLRDYFFLAPKL